MSDFEISGVATDEESAVIAAVVTYVLSEEAEDLAAPPPRPRQSDWVGAWRPRIPHVRSKPEGPLASREAAPGEEEE